MKKILLGLLVIAMVLALTACSQETYAKWAENMGKMGNNVYGIEAVLPDIGDHVAHAHDATFERRWSELLYFLRVLGASFDVFVEHVERRAVAEIEHLLSEFPVVA